VAAAAAAASLVVVAATLAVTAKKVYTARYYRVLALKHSAVRQLWVSGCGAAAAQLEVGRRTPATGAGDSDDEYFPTEYGGSEHWAPAPAADQGGGGGGWVEPSTGDEPLFDDDNGFQDG
jgi:hypothetical protein